MVFQDFDRLYDDDPLLDKFRIALERERNWEGRKMIESAIEDRKKQLRADYLHGE